MYLDAARATENTHFACCDSYPFIPGRVKPSQAESIFAVNVNMLAMREPPSTFVICSAVSVGNVPVTIDS